jgi:hypothetical protein
MQSDWIRFSGANFSPLFLLSICFFLLRERNKGINKNLLERVSRQFKNITTDLLQFEKREYLAETHHIHAAPAYGSRLKKLLDFCTFSDSYTFFSGKNA